MIYCYVLYSCSRKEPSAIHRILRSPNFIEGKNEGSQLIDINSFLKNYKEKFMLILNVFYVNS